MDQAQSRSLTALQPFLIQLTSTKSPSPRFLADLIVRATSAAGTYVFTDLLQTAAIQTLRAEGIEAEFRAHLTLLEIFSYGTYEEYKNTPDLPKLSDTQALKLRQLSLLTIASPFGSPTNPNSNALTYTSLITSMSLQSPAQLESLLTTSIYAGLLTARLAPTSSPPTVHITSVAPLRDLRPQSLPAILQILTTWESRCAATVSDLETQIQQIRKTAATRTTLQRERQAVVDAAVLAEDEPKSNSGGRGKSRGKRELDENAEDDMTSPESNEMMDVDDGDSSMGPGGRGGANAGMAAMRGNKRNRGRG